MAWFPTKSKALGFKTLADILGWCQVEPPILKALERQIGGLSDCVRQLSHIPHSVMFAGLAGAKVAAGESAERAL